MDKNTFKKYYTKKVIYYFSYILLIILLIVEFIILFLISINFYSKIVLIYLLAIIFLLIICTIISINKIKYTKCEMKYINFLLKNTPDIELKFKDLHDSYEQMKTRLNENNFTLINGKLDPNIPLVYKRSEKKRITPGSNQAYSRTNCIYEQILVLKNVNQITKEDYYKISTNLYKQFNHQKDNRKSLEKNSVYKADLTFQDIFIVLISENIDIKMKEFLKMDGRLHKEFANFYFIGIDISNKKMVFNYEQHWFGKTHVLYKGISAYFPKLDYLLFISKYILGYKKKLKFKKLIKSTEKELLKSLDHEIK